MTKSRSKSKRQAQGRAPSTPNARGGKARSGGSGGDARPSGARKPGGFLAAIRKTDRLLIVVVCVAALFRIWGITDRLPDPSLGINVLEDTAVEETDRTTMGRAWTLWNGGTKKLDLNPRTSGWPALSFYVTLGLQWAYRGYFGMTHPGEGPGAFASFVQLGAGAHQLFLFARVFGAVIGVATVILTFLLGTMVAGRLVGVGAALLLAVNPPHIYTSQHVSDPNLLALLFVLIAAFPMVRIASGEGRTRDSLLAGAMIGLAGACKYVPLVVGLPVLLAHPRGLRNRDFWLGTLAMAAALFVATPYTFLDVRITVRDLVAQRNSLFSPWVGQSTFPISLPSYLIETLPHAMGWPAYLLSIAGTVLLWRRGGGARTLAIASVVIVGVNGMLKTAQERYVLVALPFLLLGAALAFERGLAWWKERGPAALRAPAAARVTAGVVALLAVAWPIPEFAQSREILSRPDTRYIARRWLIGHIGVPDPIVTELYGPVLRAGERNFLIWPFFATQAPLVRPAYHPEFLDGVKYIVTSNAISSRFEADTTDYPVENAYYRWIREHGRLVWSSDSVRASGPLIQIRELPPNISTRAGRDSLFAVVMPTPIRTNRLGLWCADMSALFGRMGEDDRAIEWARRGLLIHSPAMTGKLYASLALAELRAGNPAAAESAATAAIQITPRDYAVHLYRGMALRELNRPDEALTELGTAYTLSGDERIHLNIGQLLADMGRYEQAAEELQSVPSGIPERAAAQRDLAVIYLNYLHRREPGIAALREAAALEPDPGQARLLRDELARLSAQDAGGTGAAGKSAADGTLHAGPTK
ncbi:MAG: glycosyltransferase family 39 protein [Hyphomicrobiales bacterium]